MPLYRFVATTPFYNVLLCNTSASITASKIEFAFNPTFYTKHLISMEKTIKRPRSKRGHIIIFGLDFFRTHKEFVSASPHASIYKLD